MKSIWNTLGLDGPTADERAIKKAYAKALKTTRPDDDPAGFMALREALDQAKFYAQYMQEDALYDNEGHNGTVNNGSLLNDYETLETAPSPQADDVLQPKPSPTTEPSTTEPPNTEPRIPDPVLRPTQTTFEPDPPPYDATALAEQAHTAPSQPQTTGQTSEILALLDDINTLLNDPKRCGDSQLWKAVLSRRNDLSIDDYTDFDNTFREGLLGFFGAFENDKTRFNRHQSPRIISPFVGTAIFTEMDWHDTDHMPPHIKEQIDWLWHDFDVMNVHKRPKAPLGAEMGTAPKRYVVESTAVNPWTVFWILFALIGVARALQALNL